MTAITEAGRKEEVAKLKKMKPKVRQFSGFGDDNRAAISAQVHVLEKDISHELIDDLYQDLPPYIYNSAQDARDWADGEEEMAPSENWEHLVE